MSAIDQVLIENEKWLTRSAVRELAIINVMSHEVRPDGTGFVDHPSDPGGATNFGISLRFLLANEKTDGDGDGYLDFDLDRDGDIDADDIRGLTIDMAALLYAEHFWYPTRISSLPPRLAVKVFDMAVNMGPVQAIKIFQRSLNIIHGAGLKDDGKIGPATLAAAEAFSSEWGIEDLLDIIRQEVAGFYKSIADKFPKFNVFLKGWLKRAAA